MTVQTIHLPLSLPVEVGRRSACRRCIEEELGKRAGISAVRVVPDGTRADHEQHTHALIELDYNPELVSLSQINGYLRRAGSCLDEAMAHVIFSVEGMVSPRHESAIEGSLNKLPGVTATASYASGTIRLEFDRRRCALPEIVRRLDHLGIRLRAEAGGVAARPVGAAGLKARWLGPVRGFVHVDLALAVLAGLFLLAGFGVHMAGGREEVRIGLLVVSYVLGGWYPGGEMAATLRRFRLNIDVLMFAAAFGAAALGHWEEGAMLLFLFSLGGAGERLAMDRARRAIAALSELAPRTAIRVEADGSQREVRVEDLAVGDLVLVQPGQRISSDGEVVKGSAAVNQAPITGESAPVDKTTGDAVFAGSINGEGALTVRVSKPASENTLAKVIRLVEEAQTTKSPTQLFADKIERWYVPVVVVATVCLLVVPPVVGWEPMREHGSDWMGWFYQAMAFLTAASPCALAIGTPAAVLSGIARAARGGVLIKGGVHLENLGRVRAVAFDKTGTLTRGRPEVTDVVSREDGLSKEELLAVTAAVERGSGHPIAQAIVNEAVSRGYRIDEAEGIEQVGGVGVRGVVRGRRVTIGKHSRLPVGIEGMEWLKEKVALLETEGKTTVAVVGGDEGGMDVLGVIGLADQPRAGAGEMVSELKRLGIRRTILLTGDNARTAAAVSGRLGVDEYQADLLPEEKLTRVRELNEKYERVAMVGDGVNDAPALATATVGIAIGGATGAGSDVALETADVALLAADLGKLPEAIGVSRFARRVIVQNLFVAMGVIAVLAPLAAMGRAPIWAAVMFHEGSTVLVVLNALRILGYKKA